MNDWVRQRLARRRRVRVAARLVHLRRVLALRLGRVLHWKASGVSGKVERVGRSLLTGLRLVRRHVLHLLLVSLVLLAAVAVLHVDDVLAQLVLPTLARRLERSPGSDGSSATHCDRSPHTPKRSAATRDAERSATVPARSAAAPPTAGASGAR